MTKNNKIQLGLIFVGLFLILATYFFYPEIKKISMGKNNVKKENIQNNKGKDISNKVKEMIADHLGIEESKVTEEANLIEDLGADIVDADELIMAFEKEFGSEISDGEAEKILTVGDVIDLIKNKEVAEFEQVDNLFENVEYGGMYDFDKKFIVESERAYILENESDIVYMTNMRVTLNMNDGRKIIITSNKGSYNKATYDCYFQENVQATDSETTILAENLDLIATKDFVTIYNNVVLTNKTNSLRADKIDYDFVKKNYRISMFDKEKVKIKLAE